MIIAVTFFMGVGYAAVNSILLNFSGNVIAKEQNHIFMTNVEYVEKDNSFPNENHQIYYADNKILKSNIILEPNQSSSEVSLKITFYNSSNNDYVFKDVYYDKELIDEVDDIYSNLDIIYTFTNQNEIITKDGGTMDVIITFKYSEITEKNINELKSTLIFKFDLVEHIVASYDYTGDYETFVVPYDGIYKIELWGASGGADERFTYSAENQEGIYVTHEAKFKGGYGGYTSGEIMLKENDKLYVYIGEQGKRTLTSTFNGGGYGGIGGTGYRGTNPEGDSKLSGYSGGGATDIRLEKGNWNNFDSLKSRIMVAAGGGGATVESYNSAGDYSQAGGLIGFSGGYYSGHPFYETGQNGKGGTQTSGGAAASIHFQSGGVTTSGTFGIGGYTTSISSQTGAGGGGGGYYGGSGASGTLAGGSGQGGGGGSSFISGHNGCNSILETSTQNNIIHTGSSKHYSGYIFTNTKMIDGFGYLWTTSQTTQTTMPSYREELTTSGNFGNGYARITYLRKE